MLVQAYVVFVESHMVIITTMLYLIRVLQTLLYESLYFSSLAKPAVARLGCAMREVQAITLDNAVQPFEWFHP